MTDCKIRKKRSAYEIVLLVENKVELGNILNLLREKFGLKINKRKTREMKSSGNVTTSDTPEEVTLFVT